MTHLRDEIPKPGPGRLVAWRNGEIVVIDAADAPKMERQNAIAQRICRGFLGERDGPPPTNNELNILLLWDPGCEEAKMVRGGFDWST